MRILKLKTLYNGVCDYVGCYGSTPGTYPPPETTNPALIYNNNPNIYATNSSTGVKFYNSAVYKDTVNKYAYVVVIAENAGYVCEYINSAGFYNTRYSANTVSNNPARTFYVGTSDNFATFETDLPVFTDYNEFLNYTTNLQNPPVVYQWSSVTEISGKMGTLSLTEILNINDGEPVNDVALSGNISLSASSALDVLIDAVVQEDSNVTVSYSIPDETYSYIKLVYKKDRMPTSPTDGTAINIAQSSTSQVISGIADGSTYWFTIFTDISESDPVSFDTVRTGWMGEEVILLYSGNSNTMTAQISDGHILFKLYSGETVIYSFNAYAGSTVSDANKIYVQFLKDDINEIAKPSLVYFDGTNYSINQETPTDEQMSDIYTWLSTSNQSI